MALGVIGISALTIKYINSNDTLVLLRDNNGDAQLSDEQKELKGFTVATQGGAWWNILFNFIAIVMSVTPVVVVTLNKYPIAFSTVVSFIPNFNLAL